VKKRWWRVFEGCKNAKRHDRVLRKQPEIDYRLWQEVPVGAADGKV